MKLRRNRFVATWRIKNSYVRISNSPRRREMKLRKNEITSPKTFPSSHGIIRDCCQGISDFLYEN